MSSRKFFHQNLKTLNRDSSRNHLAIARDSSRSILLRIATHCCCLPLPLPKMRKSGRRFCASTIDRQLTPPLEHQNSKPPSGNWFNHKRKYEVTPVRVRGSPSKRKSAQSPPKRKIIRDTMVHEVFVRHPVFNSLIAVDKEDAITLRCRGLTVVEAVPILSKYAQPGSGLFITDEHGMPRSLDEPLWSMKGDTLYYRMEKLDMRTAEKAHDELTKKYMNESEYPRIMGVGYLVRRDPLDRKVPYFLLSIDLDTKFYPDRVIGETLHTPPDGLPPYFRNAERTYCIPVEYCVASMLYAL